MVMIAGVNLPAVSFTDYQKLSGELTNIPADLEVKPV
jgi:hypothetical protein